MVKKDGVRSLTKHEQGVLRWLKGKGKEWIKLNHTEAYKHLKLKGLIE